MKVEIDELLTKEIIDRNKEQVAKLDTMIDQLIDVKLTIEKINKRLQEVLNDNVK